MAKHPKRPKDPVSRAVLIGKILVGEVEEPAGEKKNRHAQERGAKGGKVRAASLSPGKRKEIAAKAAKARWKRPSE